MADTSQSPGLQITWPGGCAHFGQIDCPETGAHGVVGVLINDPGGIAWPTTDEDAA